MHSTVCMHVLVRGTVFVREMHSTVCMHVLVRGTVFVREMHSTVCMHVCVRGTVFAWHVNIYDESGSPAYDTSTVYNVSCRALYSGHRRRCRCRPHTTPGCKIAVVLSRWLLSPPPSSG